MTRSFFILVFLLLGFASSTLTNRVQRDDFEVAVPSSRLVRPEIVQAKQMSGAPVNFLNL